MAYSSEMMIKCTSIASFAGAFVTEKIGRAGLSLYLLTLSLYEKLDDQVVQA